MSSPHDSGERVKADSLQPLRALVPFITPYRRILVLAMVALVIAFLNAVVKPILLILTLPATILSFGLFYFVINAIIVLIADWAVDGFDVDGFWWALGFSLIVSLINSALASKKESQKSSMQV